MRLVSTRPQISRWRRQAGKTTEITPICGEAIAMKPNFEWDEEKAQANLRTHKVSFDEATTVFSDPFSITIPDPDHSTDEQRYIDIGTSDKGRLLVVSYTERGVNIRIISCRKATPTERRRYEEGND